VAERLGIGPEQCTGQKPKLVYGRMTGWGQDGPLASAAGISTTIIPVRALHAIGRKGQPPVPPLNLVGDFGGGGMLPCLWSGLWPPGGSKDPARDKWWMQAMVDGSAALMAMFFTMLEVGSLRKSEVTNLLDGGAHFYGAYETKDGKYVSIGSIEPQF